VGPKATRTWWAWPLSQPAYGRELDAIVDGWKKAKAVLEAAQGAPFDRTYLAGSSNGAYFVTRLVLRGDLEPRGFHVDGFGAMSGGSAAGRGASSLEGREVRRFYVGFGSHDPASKEAARPLVALLRAAGWPVRVAENPVGHGAREVYIDEAFAFWDAARTPDGG
jgi:predicted esterase